MRMRTFLLSMMAFGVFVSCGQSLENLRATFADGKVTIEYDLKGFHDRQVVRVALTGLNNSQPVSIKTVSGDVGDVVAGVGKKIFWDASKDLGSFTGEIVFKLRGEGAPLPYRIISPSITSSVRRGKSVNITWEGGKISDDIRLELFHDSQKVSTLLDGKNAGQHLWKIPKDFSKGNYSIKISAGAQTASAGPFKVKSKIPLLLKVVPLLAVGGVLALLPGGGSDNPTTPVSNDLPAAPGPR